MIRRDPKATDLPYLTRLNWPTRDRFIIERTMIQHGGKLHGLGEGLAYHYKAAITALWPHFDWHRWSHLLIESFAENDEVPVQGPASSGKTYCASAFGLCTFWVWPTGTSIVMSSTTKDGLQIRIWGAIKELYNKARARRDWLPGRLIESKFMLTSATTGEDDDQAQDFRDGLIGVACKVGGTFVGLSNYVGLKNDRVMLIADEASLMGRGFLDSVANLRKNPSFKFFCMGNPKETTDALGAAAEPAAELGGWSSYDSSPRTQTWKTRAKRGLAVQLCGYDSPNYDYPRGLNPYKGLITPEQIENDLAYYGESSLQFSMMNLGVMPRDASTRRVITMLICEQRQAFDPPVWGDGKVTKLASLDPAYKGIGGDRCVLTLLQMGRDRAGKWILAFDGPQILVPLDAGSRATSEEQIVYFVRDYCVARGIPPENFALDATMAGTLVSAFAQVWSPAVAAITFGGKPPERLIRSGDPKKENEAYGKMVSALWFASYYLVDAGQLRGAPREAVEEASMREWKVNSNQSARRQDPVIDVEPKDDMKKRMGRSPDLWDSFVAGLELARRLGFVIGGGPGLPLTQLKLPDWALRKRKAMRQAMEQHALTYT
jgi:hypothetical protein